MKVSVIPVTVSTQSTVPDPEDSKEKEESTEEATLEESNEESTADGSEEADEVVDEEEEEVENEDAHVPIRISNGKMCFFNCNLLCDEGFGCKIDRYSEIEDLENDAFEKYMKEYERTVISMKQLDYTNSVKLEDF